MPSESLKLLAPSNANSGDLKIPTFGSPYLYRRLEDQKNLFGLRSKQIFSMPEAHNLSNRIDAFVKKRIYRLKQIPICSRHKLSFDIIHSRG